MRQPTKTDVSVAMIVLSPALIVVLAGCNLLIPLMLMQEHKRTVPPEFSKLKGKRTMVLIWAEPETLFDYPHVRLELSTYISDKIRAQVPEVTLVEPLKVEDHIQKTLDADADPQHLGKHFDAEMVVYLELLEFQVRDPGMPDLVQARIGASVAVYDLTADPDETRCYELAPVHVAEPQNNALLISRANIMQVRQEAYLKFAETVARKFYSWQEVIQ